MRAARVVQRTCALGQRLHQFDTVRRGMASGLGRIEFVPMISLAA
jgi:hypothetical protein